MSDGIEGLIRQGNIDLARRPMVKNQDGSISTVRSINVGIDGVEVLIPTVSDDGRVMDDDEAVETYKKTGQHLGMFASPELAAKYAKQLHQDQSSQYLGERNEGPDMDKDEYTEAWGEDAIQPPVEGSLVAEAKKKAEADEQAFQDEFDALTKEEGARE